MDDRMENLYELYDSLFPVEMPLLNISEELEKMEDHPDIEILRIIYCDQLLFVLSNGYIKWGDWGKLRKNELIDEILRIFLKNVKKLSDKLAYYHSIYYFLKNDEKNCLKFLKKEVEYIQKDLKGNKLKERYIVEQYVVPFKNAFNGFWNQAQRLFIPLCEHDGTHELCKLMADYYACVSNEEAVNILSSYLCKYPNIVTAKEYLGCTYYDMKMWNNAIAVFESIEEPVFFSNAQNLISFWMAWAHGKLKNHKQEEYYYRKCLEEYPDESNALNNLGYCLYEQKRYLEAKEIFERCLEEKRDVDYAGNNYVRTLIALGKNADAKKFIKHTEYKISKALKDKVKALDNSNARLKKTDSIIEVEDDGNEEFAVIEKKADLSIKKQQFSNEKLLEDELTNRIESGIPVFGLNLKIYKRYGEYGRQYIIPCGRLDLLCEDDKGNLYVIELKKDSGYDDAYKQTAQYLDWFATAEKFKDINVYGIICLNNPTKELIKKVHADKRMRLFEYQISYREL